MSQIIRVKINMDLIEQKALFKGAKGLYADITLLPNRNGQDQYGNDFMVVQDLGKEARERGERGPILGNAKFAGGGQRSQPVQQPAQEYDSNPPGRPGGSDDAPPF